MNRLIKKQTISLIDTHCHINLLIKEGFNTLLTSEQLLLADPIIQEAAQCDVKTIINVGTSIPESQNCIKLAQHYTHLFAVVGIHPTDLTESWKQDLHTIKSFIKEKEKNKIVGLGEIGLDFYRPGYNLQRQVDGFRAQIELALRYNLAIVIHTRTAPEETLDVLTEYRHDIKRGIIHCYPYDLAFAQEAIAMNFTLGIGGPVTYPKNLQLQNIVKKIPLDYLVLETDAPFLPPQTIRGKRNTPKQIKTIATFIAELTGNSLEMVTQKTTANARHIFQLKAFYDTLKI